MIVMIMMIFMISKISMPAAPGGEEAEEDEYEDSLARVQHLREASHLHSMVLQLPSTCSIFPSL